MRESQTVLNGSGVDIGREAVVVASVFVVLAMRFAESVWMRWITAGEVRGRSDLLED